MHFLPTCTEVQDLRDCAPPWQGHFRAGVPLQGAWGPFRYSPSTAKDSLIINLIMGCFLFSVLHLPNFMSIGQLVPQFVHAETFKKHGKVKQPDDNTKLS